MNDLEKAKSFVLKLLNEKKLPDNRNYHATNLHIRSKNIIDEIIDMYAKIGNSSKYYEMQNFVKDQDDKLIQIAFEYPWYDLEQSNIVFQYRGYDNYLKVEYLLVPKIKDGNISIEVKPFQRLPETYLFTYYGQGYFIYSTISLFINKQKFLEYLFERLHHQFNEWNEDFGVGYKFSEVDEISF